MQISSTDLFHHLSDFFQNPLISREPLYGIQFVFCQPACGFGFFQNKVARENHAPEAVHRKMKCRIVVFNGSNLIMYRDFSVQLFLNFSFQRLLWSLARFDFAARKFPLPFIVAIAAGGGINFVFGLDGVADDGRDNANNFHYLYPTISLLVFLRIRAGMGRSSFHVMFIGREPSCRT